MAITDMFSVPGILQLATQSSDPAAISGVAQLYAKDVTGSTRFFVIDGGGGIWQLGGASASNTGLFGTGIDGSLHFDGTTTIAGLVPSSNVYTLTSDIMATNLTIDSGVTIKSNGYRLFSNATLTNNGTVSDNGINGSNGSFGVNPSQPAPRAAGFYSAAAGSQRSNGDNNGAVLNFPYGYSTTHIAVVGGTKGNGGGVAGSNGANGAVAFQGGSGGGGGGSSAANNAADGAESGPITVLAATTGKPDLLTFLRGMIANGTTQLSLCGSGGGQGGGGGTGSTVVTYGSGGGAGGIVAIFAKILAGNGLFSAKGGNGGNGGSSALGANFGAGGAGGGGGGGFVVLGYGTNTGSCTTNVLGGTHGTGGVGTSGSGSGGDGGDGQNGAVIVVSGDGS